MRNSQLCCSAVLARHIHLSSLRKVTGLQYPNMCQQILLVFFSFASLVLAAVTNRTICFQAHDINERGADVAIFDYADYNEKILGHKSLILIPDNLQSKSGASLSKLIHRFGSSGVVFHKSDRIQLPRGPQMLPGKSFPGEAKKAGCDLVYILKSGETHTIPRYPEAFNVALVPACVHAVFHYVEHAPNIPYAAISPKVEGFDVKKNHQVVPHMVRPPSVDYTSGNMTSMRKELNISEKSFVFCRYGGKDTFSVKFVFPVVFDMLEKYPSKDKLMFLFMNTKRFNRQGIIKDEQMARVEPQHDQIRFLPSTSKIEDKERFIMTCDAMLHARNDGETFGLAVAEFSVRNKPVLTFPGEVTEHIRLLGDKGFVYHNANELTYFMTNFIENGVNKSADYNAYRDYSPQIVMNQFKKVFLDPVFGV